MKRIKSLRPTYALIDLKSYLHNINVAKQLSNSDVIAIVKADAYGHGANELSKYIFNKNAVKKFGVATISEGINLRKKLGFEPEIYILGFVDKKFYKDVIGNQLVLTIYDYNYADEFHSFLSENNQFAKISIKIDTGMSRLGFDKSFLIDRFISDYPFFKIQMLMSHMPSADSDLDYSNKQIDIFDNYIKKNNIQIPTSLFNSSAICNFNNDFDFTRPGIMTYGYVYSEKKIDLKPVMKIYSKITHIKNLKKGDKISYNGTFTADKNMKIAVIPIGYADGYSRKFSNKAKMKLGDFYVNVVGTVCMDMCMIDITNIPESEYDKEVEILGDNITAYNLSNWADTITYEILCGISDRIPRIYKG